MDPISIGASVVGGLFGFFKKKQADRSINETTQYLQGTMESSKGATAAATTQSQQNLQYGAYVPSEYGTVATGYKRMDPFQTQDNGQMVGTNMGVGTGGIAISDTLKASADQAQATTAGGQQYSDAFGRLITKDPDPVGTPDLGNTTIAAPATGDSWGAQMDYMAQNGGNWLGA
jgi:hypothetical protein